MICAAVVNQRSDIKPGEERQRVVVDEVVVDAVATVKGGLIPARENPSITEVFGI